MPTAGEINILIRARDQASKVLGRVGNAADKMRKVVRRAGIVGAVALAGLAVAAAKTFIDFDSAMTKSIAIMGDLDDQMRETMEKTARDVAKTTTFSMTQAAESYFFLASAGLSAEQSIGALPKVAEFAQAGMFDMATATDLLTDAQSALGLTVDDTAQNIENMTRISDVLVKANTLANATVEQFATSLTREAGAALKSFKIDVEEGVAVLAAFADQGVKGEIAGTGLSRILRIMTSAAVNSAEAYARMGVEVFDATGNINNLADIIGDLEGALVGLSDEQRVAALEALGFTARIQGVILPLLGTSDAIREYESELRNAAGTTAEIAEKQLESLGAQLSLLRSGFEDVLFTIGKEMEPGLRALVATLREDVIPAIETFLPQAIDTAKQLFDDWRPVIEDTAGAFRTFVEFILTNKAALIIALGLIGAAMLLAFPHVTIAVATVSIVGSIKLIMGDLDKLGISAVKARIQLDKFLLRLIDTGDTILSLGLHKVPGLGEAFKPLTSAINISGDAIEDLQWDLFQAEKTLAGLEQEAVTNQAFSAIMAGAENASARVRELRLEMALAVAAGGALGGQAVGRQLLLQVDRELMRTRDLLPSPISDPPPTDWTNDAAGAGEAVGEALAKGIERSLLDMPAVTPERLVELMRFMKAADFTTIGDQLAFVTTSANNAARAMEDAARAAAGEFNEALSELARIAGISAAQLRERLGLTNVMEDLGVALRVVAEELGITEAALLAIVNPAQSATDAAEDLARGFEHVAENSEQGAFAMIDAIHAARLLGMAGGRSAFELIDLAHAMAEVDEVARTVDASVGNLAREIASFFGITEEAVEAVLALSDAYVVAMTALRVQQLRAIAERMAAIGMSAFEIIDALHVFEEMERDAEEAAEAVDALTESFNRLAAIFKQPFWGTLSPQGIQDVLDLLNPNIPFPGAPVPVLPGGGAPGLPVPAPGGGAPGLPAGQPAGMFAPGITQHITVIVEERSPAAIARAVEQAGLELGEQLIAEGV